MRCDDTMHLQFDTDVHHRTVDICSTHAADGSKAGKGSEPAVNAHRSVITSGCSGWSFKSSCHVASSSATDRCFALYLGCSKLARKWLSVTASLKRFTTVVKCGFSTSALRRLSHSSQVSAVVALSDCSLSSTFDTCCSWAWRVLASFSRPTLLISFTMRVQWQSVDRLVQPMHYSLYCSL